MVPSNKIEDMKWSSYIVKTTGESLWKKYLSSLFVRDSNCKTLVGDFIVYKEQM